MTMNDILFTQIPVSELVGKIADEVMTRITANKPIQAPLSTTEQRLYGDRAAATYIGCTVQTIIALRKRREIPYHKYGRKYFYIASQIDATLKVEARRFGELRGRRAQ